MLVLRKYGYVRVSDRDQNESRQIQALKDSGVDEAYILIDKQSGKDFERPQYQLLRKILREGDILIVTSIDRLGRNYKEIISEWQFITHELKADIKILDMSLLDTTLHKDLLGTFISDLILQVLAYVAEQERLNIKKRQLEGISTAKSQGKHLGRPKTSIPENFKEIYKRWKNKEITAKIAMKELNLKPTNFYNLVKSLPNTFNTESEKTAEIQLWVSVENNNKFVRGKKKATENIDDYLKTNYEMKIPDYPRQNCDYVLLLKYSKIEDLKEEVYGILQEIEREADIRNCFTESDAFCEELNLTW